MTPYACYTPMTDTCEIATAYRGTPLSDLATCELGILDLRPPLLRPSRWQRLRARLGRAK